MRQWQVQEAKQRFSELLRKAHEEGPQAVTRHGEEVAFVIDVAYYRELTGPVVSWSDHLLHGPVVEDLDEELARGRAELHLSPDPLGGSEESIGSGDATR